MHKCKLHSLWPNQSSATCVYKSSSSCSPRCLLHGSGSKPRSVDFVSQVCLLNVCDKTAWHCLAAQSCSSRHLVGCEQKSERSFPPKFCSCGSFPRLLGRHSSLPSVHALTCWSLLPPLAAAAQKYLIKCSESLSQPTGMADFCGNAVSKQSRPDELPACTQTTLTKLVELCFPRVRHLCCPVCSQDIQCS